MSRFSGLLRLSAVRQTLWLLGLFSLITLAGWGATYWLVQRDMLRAVDTRLTTRMDAAVTALNAGQALPAPGDGETVALVAPKKDDGFETHDLEPDGTEMRYLRRTTPHGQIVLGENTELQEELRDILAAGMQLSLLATLLLTTIAGLWMARAGQRRLNVISDGLAEVAQGKLSRRIALSGQDDLSLLAARINATTARLDDAMTRMRVQSSNIAHDLRTPLARLRAQIEASLTAATEQGRAIDPDELTTTLDQIDRITGTFDALLRLSRIERGAGREGFAPVSLGSLVETVAETFGPVVEDAGQSLRVEIIAPATVDGDRDLLIQALANLIQNALRYGADGQTVALCVHGSRLSITDEGPGIPLAERDKVVQPLYQSEATRQGDGFGLGLSMVRATSDLHGALLSLSDGPGGRGLMVTLRFAQLTDL
ncbi:MAG: HAMP domain-containing histidine kinase [Marinibacterium sp.]|nr:HAMP domain-containing histidine kinase [Marinibacterium sp.]